MIKVEVVLSSLVLFSCDNHDLFGVTIIILLLNMNANKIISLGIARKDGS